MSAAPRLRRIGERAALVVLAPTLLLVVLELTLWALDVAPVEEALTRAEYPFDPAAIRARLGAAPGAPRVVCLGESSMAGYPLDRGSAGAGFSLCDQVAATIGARAVNLAEGGIAIRHVAERARIACEAPAPPGSLVLLYGGHNEFLNVPRRPRHSPAGPMLRALERLRTFRLLQRWTRGPAGEVEAFGDAGEGTVDRSVVLAEFERSLRAVVEACQGQPLVMATIVGNPAFHVPELPSHDDGLEDGAESPREYARRRRRDHDERVDSSTRELLIAPPEVNAIIARVANSTRTPLLDTAALTLPPPIEAFLDWVHPTVTLHQRLAGAFVDTAARAGLVTSAVPAAPTVAPATLRWADETCAADNVKLDPGFALQQLRRIDSPSDPVRVGLARLVAGFILDRQDDIAAGTRLLELAAAAGGPLERCVTALRQHGRAPCAAWPSRAVLTPGERQELLQVVGEASALVRALVSVF